MKPTKKRGFIQGFDWKLYPEAEKFIHIQIREFLKHNKKAKKIALRMEKETSTTIYDWIDYIKIPENKISESKLKKWGFKKVNLRAPGNNVYKNSGTVYPAILTSKDNMYELAIKTESIMDCIKQLGRQGTVMGEPYEPIRKAVLSTEGNYTLCAVERRGSNNFILEHGKDIQPYKQAIKEFRNRKRKFKTDKQGMQETKKLVAHVLKKLSKPRVADAFFRVEREYWQSKNKAGQIQKKRQDKLGLGWGNHDHHTFRSSRENFTTLIQILEMMGYKCRERFFAGEEAGWGAQVIEHPQCDIVVFADLDITEKERNKDFAHKKLPKADKFRTVGLWVALHGESILQAGMHHLEARFSFDKLKRDLPKHKIKMMKPFSNFKFLKQAFTEAEIWKVEPTRLNNLHKKGIIDKAKYQEIKKHGTIGSHLENLQRKQGYKGFNQDSVSAIIKITDPKKFKKQQGA